MLDYATVTPFITDRQAPLRPRAPAPERVAWIDKARGLGIALVVVGHATGGLIDAHRTPGGGVFQLIFATIYVFHMPLFFILSAYFVPARLKRGAERFARSWWRGLIWPALLWSLAMILVLTAADQGALNHAKPAVLEAILHLPITPVGPFWFIYVLLALHMVVTVFELAQVGEFAPFALVMLAALRDFADVSPLVHLIFSYAPWYAAGLVLGGWRGGGLPLLRLQWPAKLLVLAGVVELFLLTGPAMLSQWPVQMLGGTNAIIRMVWTPRFMALAFAGACATAICADALRGRAAQIATYLGQRSMVIYVLHVIVVATTRTAMVHLAVREPWLMMIGESLLGVTMPLAIFAAASRLGISNALGLGRPIARPAD